MQLQVHSDNHIEGSARLVGWVRTTVASKFERYDEELTRVVIHLNDENGNKAGANDKRCQIEARAKGGQPLSVTHKAESLEFALDGAMEKLGHALAHRLGKQRNKRTTGGREVVGSVASRDRLLEEDFLAEQQLRIA
ncbi:Sigma 54 modulation protein / S30EA ribosomal protein [Azotobacter beijerinckii]|uniref:Sigma 54 modulation protein / S30EA ribosomal protein n=1 Tax=Azotobacter beijerinckii TaxID=170623 RepID=A0A1H9PCB7_9GAMM|nr:HPF/RaiA family ribosome-associated protein [Azotobacter beijerinckii]MDV7211559.1 HPF/RaiA family ribosome-associated protein [Azotobacter beijerinckii]SEJ20662.1 Sigma 54 modulation protein / S30EA ribosomal protein [Azotobacter beijerinckii]SEJ63098.1 Sigma 54 modulation protein / S30EA ribosomal protein [Azotobacter beijerinckii]SER45821.1 Sigma 54 modulation protein / S30EA ribosomal protein [Azotobacter beijerinckii]SFL52948.1 Sigma 54 modulation protein / S30EA ribosomal protein [Azo